MLRHQADGRVAPQQDDDREQGALRGPGTNFIKTGLPGKLILIGSNYIALTSVRRWSRRPTVSNDMTGIWHENQ